MITTKSLLSLIHDNFKQLSLYQYYPSNAIRQIGEALNRNIKRRKYLNFSKVPLNEPSSYYFASSSPEAHQISYKKQKANVKGGMEKFWHWFNANDISVGSFSSEAWWIRIVIIPTRISDRGAIMLATRRTDDVPTVPPEFLASKTQPPDTNARRGIKPANKRSGRTCLCPV